MLNVEIGSWFHTTAMNHPSLCEADVYCVLANDDKSCSRLYHQTVKFK